MHLLGSQYLHLLLSIHKLRSKALGCCSESVERQGQMPEVLFQWEFVHQINRLCMFVLYLHKLRETICLSGVSQ